MNWSEAGKVHVFVSLLVVLVDWWCHSARFIHKHTHDFKLSTFQPTNSSVFWCLGSEVLIEWAELLQFSAVTSRCQCFTAEQQPEVSSSLYCVMINPTRFMFCLELKLIWDTTLKKNWCYLQVVSSCSCWLHSKYRTWGPMMSQSG